MHPDLKLPDLLADMHKALDIVANALSENPSLFHPAPDFMSSGAGSLRDSPTEELEREIMIDCDWPTFIDVPR